MRRPTSTRTAARAGILAAVMAPSIALVAVPAFAAGTTSGNLIIDRVGDGSAALTSAGTAVFLDEYTTAGSKVQSIPAPTTTSGSQHALVDSGSATSDGQITNSADGRYVLVPGYTAAVGASGVASGSTSQTLGELDGTGALDTSTTTTAFNGNNIRSASSRDGSSIASVGGQGGAQTEAFGAASSTTTSAGTENLRVVHVTGTETFVSSGSGSAKGIGVAAGGADTLLPGVTTPGSTYGFALLRTGTGPTFQTSGADTLYFADDTSATAGGLFKYVWNGTTWTAAGSISGTKLRGVAARVVGSTVEIYSTIDATLFKTIDTSGTGTLNGVLTPIATATTNTAFRGVAFAPQAPPAPDLPEVASAVLLPLSGVAIAGAFVWSRRRRTPATA